MKMMKNFFKGSLLLLIFNLQFLISNSRAQTAITQDKIWVGAERTELYLGFLTGKSVALVVNQTSLVDQTPLLDTLISLGVNVKKVFAPEHGFRGTADAGAHVNDSIDEKTGVKIISLYGNKKKPSAAELADVDWVVFDIQDVGARFFTYISTLQYVMEACADNGKDFLLLDRPNPNGFYIDGPVLDTSCCRSFVGMQPVPVVYGMTEAEYAKMLIGEHWLNTTHELKFHYIDCRGYTHNSHYKLPVKPSPNLPNMTSVYLYPSICFFEGTVASLGRGTAKPFQCIGDPSFSDGDYFFTPKSMPGATNPPHLNQTCSGIDFSSLPDSYFFSQHQLMLQALTNFYKNFPVKENFFTPYFQTLAGTPELRKQIESGMDVNSIRDSWQEKISEFKAIRKGYLLYPDFY